MLQDYVDSVEPPICPYCGHTMVQNHSHHNINGVKHYLTIEFKCRSDTHTFMIRGRTISQWERELKTLKGML